MDAAVRDGGVVTHLKGLDSRIGTLDTRVGSLESRIGTLETKVEALDSRIGTLETKVERLDSRVGAVDARVISLETKWDAVIPTLATRADLEVVRGEMKEGFGLLRAEIHESYAGMAKWFIGTLISVSALAVAAMAIVLAPQMSRAQGRVDVGMAGASLEAIGDGVSS